ncbi:hypothetical protein [Thiomicrorhabdus aquaedulcis]|nr:hypothetical protein [Thiomicrorhabdus aquaedulcis]
MTLLTGLVLLSLTTPLMLPHLQELVQRAVELITSLRLNEG